MDEYLLQFHWHRCTEPSAAVGRLAHQTHTALILSQYHIGGITRVCIHTLLLLRGPDKFRTEHSPRINYVQIGKVVKVGPRRSARQVSPNTTTKASSYMPVERPATHHESRRPVSSLSFNQGGNGMPRRPATNQGHRENNFQKYQRQRILLLNRQGVRQKATERQRPSTTGRARGTPSSQVGGAKLLSFMQHRNRQRHFKKNNSSGNGRPVSGLCSNRKNVKKVGLYAALQGSPKQLSPRPSTSTSQYNARASSSIGIRKDLETAKTGGAESRQSSGNSFGARPATAIGTSFYKNYNTNVNRYNLHTNIEEMIKRENKKRRNRSSPSQKRPATGIMKKKNGYEHGINKRPSTTKETSRRAVTSRVSFNTKAPVHNDLDSYIPSNSVGNDQDGVGESNLKIDSGVMNNTYDAEPKDRMHVDTKELHALINRMENMVDEQRLKTAPWELKNDKVYISEDKKNIIDDETESQ